MRTAVIVMAMFGLLMIYGCDNSRLVTCQKENDSLKAQLSKAQTDVKNADQRVAEMAKKDQETQTKALEAVRVMLERQEVKNKEKDARIKQLESDLEKLKTAAGSK